jgi:hypothetical protein
MLDSQPEMPAKLAKNAELVHKGLSSIPGMQVTRFEADIQLFIYSKSPPTSNPPLQISKAFCRSFLYRESIAKNC